MGSRLPCGISLAAAILVAAPAAAEPAHHVALRWRSEAGCIDRATIAATVEQTLGRPVFHSSGHPAATVEGVVAATDAGGFHANITMRSPEGQVLAEREVATDAPSCSRLDESAAIVIALMVDGVPEPAPAPPPPPPPTPLRIPREPPRPRPGPVFEGEAGLAYTFGLLPRVTTGAYLRLGVGLSDSWSIGLAIHGWLPPSQAVVEPGVGAGISALAVELGACFFPARSRIVRFGPCLVGGAGATFAKPFGLVDAAATERPLAFVGADLALAVRVNANLSALVRLGLWGLPIYPRYVFHPADGAPSTTLFQASQLVGGVTFGLGVRGGS